MKKKARNHEIEKFKIKYPNIEKFVDIILNFQKEEMARRRKAEREYYSEKRRQAR
ncbi:MAG: hypothetical protein FWD82_06390 [Defluviitaleaceae bacterium]|nr:hypothetical protein [Defluviitaleaceae bacterium]